MKKVKASELEVGKLYYDIDDDEAAIQLEYMGEEKGIDYFKQVSGEEYYVSHNHPEFGTVIGFSNCFLPELNYYYCDL